MILNDSQISLELILIDSWISLKTDSHWFSPILDWFPPILIDSHQFSVILTDSWWFLNKSGIDSHWFSNKSKDWFSWWFSLILTISWWFSPILDDYQISLELILIDSQISLKTDSHWFSPILDDSRWFPPILNDSWISLELILNRFSNKSKDWFSVILANYQWFLMILANSQWFSNKSGIDSHWFLNKSKDWFSLILANSQWFSLILTDSQWLLK